MYLTYDQYSYSYGNRASHTIYRFTRNLHILRYCNKYLRARFSEKTLQIASQVDYSPRLNFEDHSFLIGHYKEFVNFVIIIIH